MTDKSSLYRLAYRFRNLKIWKQIAEDEIFAVQLPDDVAYCSVTGRGGEHMAVSAYIGAQAFGTFLNLLNAAGDSPKMILVQDCVQCSIEKREQFSPEELEEIKSFCQSAGLAFRSPFPQFSRYYPFCIPWYVTSESDWQALETVLAVVDRMTDWISTKGKEALELRSLYEAMEEGKPGDREQMSMFADGNDASLPDHDRQEEYTIPLYEIRDGELHISGRLPLPSVAECTVSPPDRFDEKMLEKLRKRKQKGVFECEVIRLPEPVDGEPPYFPAVMMTIDAKSGILLQPVAAKGAVYDPDEMIDGFLGNLIKEQVYPTRIKVRTQETRILLEEFCKRVGIWLDVTEKMDMFDEAIDTLTGGADGAGDYSEDKVINDLTEMLDRMTVDQIAAMPAEVLLRILEYEEDLPRDISSKVREAVRRR